MDSDLTIELARRIVGVAAPAEVVLFDELASARRAGRNSSRQRALNSGLSEAVQVITPIAVFVASKIVDLAVEAAMVKAGKRARRWWWPLRRRLGTAEVDQTLVPIGHEHRGLVHHRAVEAAMECGLTREQAEQLAAAVVVVAVQRAGETE